MLLMILNFFLCVAGLIVMSLATWRFHKLIDHDREASYNSARANFYARYLSLAMMYLFLGGFVFSIAHIFQRPASTVFTLFMAVFFLGAVFINASTISQIKMTKLLRLKNMEIMKTFVNAIDLKDSYTMGHSEHVYDLVNLLYEYLPDHHRERLNKAKLLDAAMLHDCGKISIKDEILNKRGRLNQEDWESIKSHASTGKKMLDDTYFSDISDWVLYHHERIDGKGYYGLIGNEIPLESRIIAIADTYSALSTNRIYRKRYSHEQAIEIMAMATGSQLDTELMGCFMRIPFRDLEKVRPPESQSYGVDNSQSESPSSAAHDGPRPGSTYYLQ